MASTIAGGGGGEQSGGSWGFQLGRALTLALAMLRPHGFGRCYTRRKIQKLLWIYYADSKQFYATCCSDNIVLSTIQYKNISSFFLSVHANWHKRHPHFNRHSLLATAIWAIHPFLVRIASEVCVLVDKLREGGGGTLRHLSAVITPFKGVPLSPASSSTQLEASQLATADANCIN